MSIRDPHSTHATIEVVEEQVELEKREVVTGKVTLHKTVDEEEVPLEGTLWSETAEVKRVPIDRYVERVPKVRHEGNTTIIPVVREVLVKRLLLVEEVHVQRQKTSTRYADTVTVRREQVLVERTTDADASD